MKPLEFTSHLQKVVDHFKEELTVIRSGRATSALVEDVKVEAYAGTFMSLREVASITVPDPTVIIITPWDTSVIPAIEKALRLINGASFNPVADKAQLRLPIPPLSEERRHKMVKIVRAKLEDARVAIRNIRQDEMKTLDEEEENGAISKDERFKTRENVEAEVKKFNSHLEDEASKKEQELLKI